MLSMEVAPPTVDPNFKGPLKINTSGYSAHHSGVYQFRELVQKTARIVKEAQERWKFDAIAVTGKSGLSMAFALMLHVDIPFILVRKKTEKSHGSDVESTEPVTVKTYAVLDDCVCSGSTVRRIHDSIREWSQSAYYENPKLVGLIMYTETSERTEKQIYIDQKMVAFPTINVQANPIYAYPV